MLCVENYSPTSNLWKKCEGAQYIQPLKYKGWRVIEDQSRSSTRELVDSLEEHEILENLLEQKSKPSLPNISEFNGYHFLLTTPFRYPPLKHGSRFGGRHERSLWYGALDIETSFGEAAFYRFLFFAGTEADLLPCLTSHSVYSVNIHTSRGIALTTYPFNTYTSLISQKDSYTHSQLLGTTMRNLEVMGFTYFSARVENKINIALFTPRAFTTKSIDNLQHWQCYTDKENVEFTRNCYPERKAIVYKKSSFLVNNHLPFDYTAA